MAKWSGQRLITVAALLGLCAGCVLIYVRNVTAGNPSQTGECEAAARQVAELGQAATGEVASFITEPHPVPVRDLRFFDRDGQERHLSDFSGRSLLLNLWATWCIPCRSEMPALDQLQTRLGGDDFSVIAVSVDLGTAEKPLHFLDEIKVRNLPFFHDPKGQIFQDMRAAGRAIGLPATMLVDAKGCVRGHMAGPADWASPEALTLIRTMLMPHK